MKSTVEKVDATTVILTVEVGADELTAALNHAYQHIGSQITVPGFRKGKVPNRIIDQRVGRQAVMAHAVDDAVPEFYRQAVAEEKLRPLGQPDVEVTKIPEVDDAEVLEFTANVEVRPDVEIPDVAGKQIDVSALEVSDEDVETSLNHLRERFGTLVGVDRPAADGDFVVIDLSATVDGEEVDSLSGQSYQIGGGNMLEGLDEALTGLSAGESTTFTSALAGGEHAGKDAEITVTASAVKERELPEADDDFAQLASEFDTIDELREDLRTAAASGRAQQLAIEARNKLVEFLLEATEIPVPQRLVEAEINDHLEREGRLEDEEHRAEVTEQTTDAVREQILLDTIAEAEGVNVGQEELINFMVSSARQYGMDPNEFIKMMADRGQVPAVVAEVARSKGIAALLRKVKVVDADGKPVDITPFLGPEEKESTTEFIDVTDIDTEPSSDDDAETSSDDEAGDE